MKKNNQIERAEMLIKSDRLTLKQDFINLFSQDLSGILKEYFDCAGLPKLEVYKSGGRYIINVTAVADGIKFFNKLN